MPNSQTLSSFQKSRKKDKNLTKEKKTEKDKPFVNTINHTETVIFSTETTANSIYANAYGITDTQYTLPWDMSHYLPLSYFQFNSSECDHIEHIMQCSVRRTVPQMHICDSFFDFSFFSYFIEMPYMNYKCCHCLVTNRTENVFFSLFDFNLIDWSISNTDVNLIHSIWFDASVEFPLKNENKNMWRGIR